MSQKRMLVDVVFRSASGKSLTGRAPGSTSKELADYAASESTQQEAVQALRELGLELVGPPSPFGVSVSGSPELIRQVFGGGELKVPVLLSAWIESVRIPPPGKFFA